MRYLIPLPPSQVNGKLQTCEGRIQLRLPNYTRLYPEGTEPKIADDSINFYVIEALPEQINIVVDDGVETHLLWQGSHQRRDNPSAIVTCPIASLAELK